MIRSWRLETGDWRLEITNRQTDGWMEINFLRLLFLQKYDFVEGWMGYYYYTMKIMPVKRGGRGRWYNTKIKIIQVSINIFHFWNDLHLSFLKSALFVLSYPILSYPILSYPIRFYPRCKLRFLR